MTTNKIFVSQPESPVIVCLPKLQTGFCVHFLFWYKVQKVDLQEPDRFLGLGYFFYQEPSPQLRMVGQSAPSPD